MNVFEAERRQHAEVQPVRYFDREFKVVTVRVLPGQFYASADDDAITTVLGSCVSTCLWDPLVRIGGMNHFMLPGESATPSQAWGVSARYGLYAMEVLINEMIRLGADRRRLKAKVFGGARVLAGLETIDIGAKNSEFVLSFLQTENIPVLAQDLLGGHPRKIYFSTATGLVQLKKLHLAANTVQRTERDYFSQLAKSPGGGEVEIFPGRG